ncbi:hypothetical protein PVK06_014837 [Gossypium arboreum]|uniref:RNase H type-1 domain-containing protein n=1 Tax=Gossypium arboreum TaxID=29729 RepID=A0ABR0PVK7_GOSAR|nr:hypothetical protein PVK06_014837 [Gossypium arboreum]
MGNQVLWLLLGVFFEMIKIILESDSREAVELINRQDFLSSLGLVRDIQQLRKRQWDVRVVHVPRQTNKAADILTKLALGSRLDLYQFGAPVPVVLQQISQEQLQFFNEFHSLARQI